MQTLNLVRLSESDIEYNISHFPDGEVQISFEDVNRKEEVLIICRITNAEELFILAQAIDILRRQEVGIELRILYLMGSRMDRVMDFNRPLTLKLILSMLNLTDQDIVHVFGPHNLGAIMRYTNANAWEWDSNEWSNHIPTEDDFQIVIPDAGAADRYALISDEIICKKVRDVKTGHILSIEVENPNMIKNEKPLLIIDDLCDGGGTFVGVAEAIHKIDPYADLNICVNHMVNPKGIENLSKNFNHVWFSNSYKDWTNLPNNVTLIKVV